MRSRHAHRIVLIIRETPAFQSADLDLNSPKVEDRRERLIYSLGLKMWRSFIFKSKLKMQIPDTVSLMCAYFRNAWAFVFALLPLPPFLTTVCKWMHKVLGWAVSDYFFFHFSFFFFSSEMVKCLPNVKPAPKAQLVCSKTGGIESCFLSCPSNTLFVPGLYKVYLSSIV